MVLDEQARYGLYWLVANLAEAGPLAIVVDDAQWADGASLDWLAFLARRLEDLPVLLALGVRAGDPGAGAPALEAIRAEPLSDACCGRPSLDAAETADLATRLWGRPVDDDFAAACHAWTGGNPHYISEVVAGLRADGLDPDAAPPSGCAPTPPERLSTLTRQRLARLSEPAVALAEAVAVLAGGARLDRAAVLAGLDPAAAATRRRRARRRPACSSPPAPPSPSSTRWSPASSTRRSRRPAAAPTTAAPPSCSTPRAAAPSRSPPSSCGCRPAGDEWVLDRLLAAAGEALAHGSAGLGRGADGAGLGRAAARRPRAPRCSACWG